MKYTLPKEYQNYLEEYESSFRELLLQLCRIPAPLHGELARAQFCKQWLEERGAEGVYIDEEDNMIYPYSCQGDEPVVVIQAHTDTVFQETEPFTPVFKEGKILCPGVGDDTVHVALLLMMAQFLLLHPEVSPVTGIVFVANSGEEGLGNLRGTKAVMKQWQHRTQEFISLDGQCHEIFTKAVGSVRMKFHVHTAGGHSYGDFGKPNAIQIAAGLITDLYQMKINETTKKDDPYTTYNVGSIQGGGAVNVIAPDATFTFEYRAGNQQDADSIQKQIDSIVKKYEGCGGTIGCDILGVRPFGTGKASESQERLISKIKKLLEAHGDIPVRFINGSTDCNVPLSLGIPAVAFGCYEGGGAHTMDEFLLESCLPNAFAIAMGLIYLYTKTGVEIK